MYISYIYVYTYILVIDVDIDMTRGCKNCQFGGGSKNSKGPFFRSPFAEGYIVHIVVDAGAPCLCKFPFRGSYRASLKGL